MRGGGRLIIDGAELRGNMANIMPTGGVRNIAGVLFGSVDSYGCFILMNDGKITGNMLLDEAGDTMSAGVIHINGYGMIVMHGGEISGNTLDLTAAPTNAKAGVINISNGSSTSHGTGSFYMTGGVIRGNRVIGPAANVASAGAILVNGSFQKTGGIIYGSNETDPALANTTTMTGNVAAGAVVVLNAFGQNPTDAFVRNHTSGPEDFLFVHSRKNTNGVTAENTLPAWANSFWDE